MSLNKSKSLRTAEKYVLQGKIPAAIDEYRKVVEADPGDLTTINTLGDLYVRAGRIQDAIRNFSRIADSYREGGFTLKAIAMLKKISKLDPTNVETAMKLANLYSQQGLLVEARQQYLQVADAFARNNQAHKALEAYQKIADLDPSNTSVRLKLGEIYSREGMPEQAHDAFLMAGTELLRKGDLDHALTANLKAIAINPDSRHALTAVASIYTQQGQAERAINLLCEAFERSPGDVELLTILGRTYLGAGWMDDAERTFLSLVELDRSRYHYLLEVGRRFLQMENFDRAAEMIDGCLDILIAKREEDKAIDFLRRILDQDINHTGSLKRLAQIFMRIREDHNLIATLASLVEAALQKGDNSEAIAALKELVRLEPDEPQHVQRLKSLGGGDVHSLNAGDVVPTTGPLDYKAAVLDEAFIIRQISEAEILAGHGKVDEAVVLLEEILRHAPDTIQLHLKLKDIYLRAGRLRDAAATCVELARIHEVRGETARSSDYLAEARHLNPSLDTRSLDEAMHPVKAEPEESESALGFEMNFPSSSVDLPSAVNTEQDSGSANAFGFEMFESAATDGSLVADNSDSFAIVETSFSVTGQGDAAAAPVEDASSTRHEEPDARPAEEPEAASLVFKAAGNMPTDTMPRALRDELEGIEFYIAQGYVEIAQDTLDRLRGEHGEYPEITALYKRLGVTPSAPHEPLLPEMPSFDSGNSAPPSAEVPQAPAQEINLNLDEAFGFTDETRDSGFHIDVERAPKEGEHQNVMPFLIEKESGHLDQDLLVKFNTSELSNQAVLDTEQPLKDALVEPDPASDSNSWHTPDEEDHFDAIVSELESAAASHSDSSVDLPPFEVTGFDLPSPDEIDPSFGSPAPEPTPKASATDLLRESLDAAASRQAQTSIDMSELLFAEDSDESELQNMLDELREDSDGIAELQDYETHYNLGLAYKDMDLLDEAIEQFQMAARLAQKENSAEHQIQCCHMLGFCFKKKAMPKVAVMWFYRGLKMPNSNDDEYQALRFEIGLCYEEMGETDKALDIFVEVYGIDVNYRNVSEKIKQLQAAKSA